MRHKITKDQCKDTGMAMVLLLLIFSALLKRPGLVAVAIVVLLVNMLVPQVFQPVAILWLGLSHLLGTVISKLLLTLIFFLLVTPIGLARRLLGRDSLKLKAFKTGKDSVMLVRNHTFNPQDLEKPY